MSYELCTSADVVVGRQYRVLSVIESLQDDDPITLELDAVLKRSNTATDENFFVFLTAERVYQANSGLHVVMGRLNFHLYAACLFLILHFEQILSEHCLLVEHIELIL